MGLRGSLRTGPVELIWCEENKVGENGGLTFDNFY